MFNIVKFDPAYRDDTIFCVLLAQEELGRIPELRADLLGIQTSYFDKGDMFWVAIDKNGRVVGTLGTQKVSETEMWLKRFFIKPSFKRQGLGSGLLGVAEQYAILEGITHIHTRFAEDFLEAPLFYHSKGFTEFKRAGKMIHLIKKL